MIETIFRGKEGCTVIENVYCKQMDNQNGIIAYDSKMFIQKGILLYCINSEKKQIIIKQISVNSNENEKEVIAEMLAELSSVEADNMKKGYRIRCINDVDIIERLYSIIHAKPEKCNLWIAARILKEYEDKEKKQTMKETKPLNHIICGLDAINEGKIIVRDERSTATLGTLSYEVMDDRKTICIEMVTATPDVTLNPEADREYIINALLQCFLESEKIHISDGYTIKSIAEMLDTESIVAKTAVAYTDIDYFMQILRKVNVA